MNCRLGFVLHCTRKKLSNYVLDMNKRMHKKLQEGCSAYLCNIRLMNSLSLHTIEKSEYLHCMYTKKHIDMRSSMHTMHIDQQSLQLHAMSTKHHSDIAHGYTADRLANCTRACI